MVSTASAHVAFHALQRFGNTLGSSLPCSLGHAPQSYTLLEILSCALPWYGAPGAVPPVLSSQYLTEQYAGSCLAGNTPEMTT